MGVRSFSRTRQVRRALHRCKRRSHLLATHSNCTNGSANRYHSNITSLYMVRLVFSMHCTTCYCGFDHFHHLTHLCPEIHHYTDLGFDQQAKPLPLRVVWGVCIDVCEVKFVLFAGNECQVHWCMWLRVWWVLLHQNVFILCLVRE